ncbi:MAG: hypothetical protein RR845_13890, partial [Pseudomonas sp.]
RSFDLSSEDQDQKIAAFGSSYTEAIWRNGHGMADGLVGRTNPMTAGQQLHVQSGGDASWTILFN